MSQISRDRFEALVRPHFEALYRAALRLTRSTHDAEDLVQEVCLRACRELETLERLEHVLGWLLRIQYRLFVDGDRRRRRSPIHSGDGADDFVDRVVCEFPGPEELAGAAAGHRSLEAAWARLRPEQRALLALHAEGYDLADLERITGSNRNALSARLHRARMRLSKLLAHAESANPRMTPAVTRHEL